MRSHLKGRTTRSRVAAARDLLTLSCASGRGSVIRTACRHCTAKQSATRNKNKFCAAMSDIDAHSLSFGAASWQAIHAHASVQRRSAAVVRLYRISESARRANGAGLRPQAALHDDLHDAVFEAQQHPDPARHGAVIFVLGLFTCFEGSSRRLRCMTTCTMRKNQCSSIPQRMWPPGWVS